MMSMSTRLLLLVVFYIICGPSSSARAAAGVAAPVRSNVLYLIADDLRPEMAGPASYAQKQAITPNIDKLASSAGAVTFSNAYCQQAVCGPSRNSL